MSASLSSFLDSLWSVLSLVPGVTSHLPCGCRGADRRAVQLAVRGGGPGRVRESREPRERYMLHVWSSIQNNTWNGTCNYQRLCSDGAYCRQTSAGIGMDTQGKLRKQNREERTSLRPPHAGRTPAQSGPRPRGPSAQNTAPSPRPSTPAARAPRRPAPRRHSGGGRRRWRRRRRRPRRGGSGCGRA